ncbi:MAG: aldo/keto reductase [Opitutaceae bacterium]|nr:aldo/keto reductase [Opitutaceae bacterium]
MSTPHKPLRWGILSTGRIAGVFAKGLAESKTGKLVAVGSRSATSAARFAGEHHIDAAHAHACYAALLADAAVEAVYIATPHPEHVEWAVKAAEAGKHVLCEKPAGLNHAEAMVMIQAARRAGVVFMEAFMYRCHPQTAKVVELVRGGAIGRVRLVQAAFGFRSDYKAESRLWANALGGGGILDVGCYAMSFARLVAGAAAGGAATFADPVSVVGAGQLHPESGVDALAAATLRFADGLVAQVTTSVGCSIDNTARIFGDDGWIEIPHPWVITKGGGGQVIRLHRRGAAQPELFTTEAGNLYALEADAFASALREGRRDVPAMSADDTLGNLAALDAWRAAIGLEYAAEKPEAAGALTHARRPLARRADAAMPTGRIAGLAKPVSRLVLGCDNQRTMPHAAAMFDDYFERGGNAFDTAYIYGGGRMERLLGAWLRARGVREQAVVLVKGGHTPFCTPEHVVRQLHESLERLGTDHCDLYCMHRDNPAVPVGEFVEALAGEARAGRIRGNFGGSNWSLARLAEARAYAKAKGLPGFGVLSNQFSLARMVEAPWGGCISASDTETRRWLAERAGGPDEVALLAWSSQARGFFTDRAGPERRDDAELVRCWYADDNWARRARLVELAREKGVTPPALAAAYVLAQPFPAFALIGPRTLAETDSSLECLRVKLTAEERAWLNLERETRG